MCVSNQHLIDSLLSSIDHSRQATKWAILVAPNNPGNRFKMVKILPSGIIHTKSSGQVKYIIFMATMHSWIWSVRNVSINPAFTNLSATAGHTLNYAQIPFPVARLNLQNHSVHIWWLKWMFIFGIQLAISIPKIYDNPDPSLNMLAHVKIALMPLAFVATGSYQHQSPKRILQSNAYISKTPTGVTGNALDALRKIFISFQNDVIFTNF